jgi:hypothetical protein
LFCFVLLSVILFYSRKATKVTKASYVTNDCFVTQRSVSATCATFRDIFEGCAGAGTMILCNHIILHQMHKLCDIT